MTIITTCVFSSPISEIALRKRLNLGEGTHIRTLSPDIAYDIEAADIETSLLDEAGADYCVQDALHHKKQLLISDMDSTIIGQECIDEIADIANVKARVSEITERAMAGELDFSASLIARVALLEGLSTEVLETVWRERISLNKGARELVQTMKRNGAFTMLVSGGFTFFTERVADVAGFDAHHANELHHEGGKLTGRVIPPILHSGSKRDYLHAACKLRNINMNATLAVGDGANDKDMIEAASLGVAYYAKPYLCNVADAAIRHTDLRSLLYFQGYSDDEISS